MTRSSHSSQQPQQKLFARTLSSASKTTLFSALLVVATTSSLSALELYVSPAGDDAAAGTKDAPFLTPAHARDHVRKSSALGKEPVTVHLAAGTYYLPEALRLGAEDSGTKEAQVIWQGESDGKVILSGARPLKLSWKEYKDGIFQAETPAGLSIDQLFVNAQLEHMARYPNYDPKITVYNGYAADAFSPERAANWKNPAGGYIHAIHAHHWGGYHYRITGKNKKNEVQYEGGWQNNRQMGMHKSHRFVENIFEELDAPREWFHDAKTNTLYYYPPEGTDLKTASFEIALLPHLIEVVGTQESPAKHIHLKGISFRQTARTFMETKEPLLRSDWTIYRGGAVFFKGAEDCSIADSEFTQIGGNAIFASHYNRRLSITGSHIHGVGASGVCFVGSPDTVRNPLFEYNETQSLKDIDLTPGPKSDDYPADSIVDDCL
ncbi:MAG: signaling protein, partial [Verrucomicrobiaceae bacterium]|nr:signaling protein [Verrucomicrobiaceae bacterium]